MNMPAIPAGDGQHPVPMIAITAHNLPAASAFYRALFGWQMQPLFDDVTAAVTPAGPTVSLRRVNAPGFPGVVPYVRVAAVDAALARVVADGGTVERATWSVAIAGKLARFKDASGTIDGLTDMVVVGSLPAIPLPFGDNPKPVEGSICSLEMYANDGEATAAWFKSHFGWGAISPMPQYMMFDPGAGIGGVWQSHTRAMSALAYIDVGDVAATLNAIEAAGGKRTAEPMHAPGMGTFGYFTDVCGTSMGLMGP